MRPEMSAAGKRSLRERVALARHLLREYEAEEARERKFMEDGGMAGALERLRAFADALPAKREQSGSQLWREAAERYARPVGS